jgi:hypothetical protein
LLTVRSVLIAAGQGGGPRVVACGVGFHWPTVLQGSSFRCVEAAGWFASLLASIHDYQHPTDRHHHHERA